MSNTPLPASALARMGIFAGHWRADLNGGVLEEMWLAPRGGVAQGSVRLVWADKVETIELIIVAAEQGRVVMRYNHFHPNYRTWEDDGPITLVLTAATDREMIFTNLQTPPRHAKEAGYRLTGADTMNSWVIALDAEGKAERFSFDYRRVG